MNEDRIEFNGKIYFAIEDDINDPNVGCIKCDLYDHCHEVIVGCCPSGRGDGLSIHWVDGDTPLTTTMLNLGGCDE